MPLGAQAAPLTPTTAEGDSYGVQVIASFAGGAPLRVGPVAPAYATVPPGVTTGSQSGTVISGPAGPLNPLVSALNVTNDTAKATLVPVATTDCQPNQGVQDCFTGPLSGGNGCSTIANAEALNTGGNTVLTATPQVKATGIFSQSVTQQCDPSLGLPTGSAKVVSLHIGPPGPGGDVIIPNPIPPNTTIALPNLATVILNEQKLEHLSGGQGLTVNAIHVFTVPQLTSLVAADVIIGHSHSNATCTTPPSKQPCAVAGAQAPRCLGVIITKTDNTGTETAKPGQTITYTLSLNTTNDDHGACKVTQVIDTLPPGFTFVSASGALGTPLSVVGQVVTWFNGTGFTGTSPLVETIVAKIAANEPDGFFSNQVDVLSSCGENPGSSPPIHNIVTPAATPTATPAAANLPAATKKLPFTGTTAPDGSVWLGVILLGLVLSAVAAARVLRQGPID